MIEHLTENVARARLALDEASLAHTAATEKLNALQQRIRDVEARRAAITQCRLAGESTADEANEFVALGGDLDVLRELAADAKLAVDRAVPAEQRNQLARAEGELQDAQHQAEFDAIVAHAQAAEQVYLECLRQVWAAAQERGHLRTFGEAFKIDGTIQNLVRYNSFFGLGVTR